MLKMIGSKDSVDFCPERPVTEKNAIPLDCYHDINLCDIWIPSHLLPNRSMPNNMRVPQGVYHTLEKKEPSKYAKSFSVYPYSNIKIEQGEIFVSDSDDDIFGSESTSFEKIEVSDDMFPAIANHVSSDSNACSNDSRNGSEIIILNTNSERRDNKHINPEENLNDCEGTSSYLKEMHQLEKGRNSFNENLSSNENLMNNPKNLKASGKESTKSLSHSVNIEPSQVNKNTDSVISLKDIVDDTPEISSNENLMNKPKKLKASGKEGAKSLSHSVNIESSQINKNTDSVISLKDIVDDTPEISIKEFAFDFKKRDDSILLCSYDRKEKKNKKDKVKKKSSKYLTLDDFLETKADNSQDYYCDKYFQSILKQKHKNNYFSNIPIGSNVEFPDLAPEKCKFIHSDKTAKKTVEPVLNKLSCDLNKSEDVNENVDVKDVKPSITDTTYGKIAIENIPPDVIQEDVLAILCGYGEIRNFSLVPAGNFLTAYVEIDLSCDIDWIIECLNGSEPFGASTEKLQCYKQMNLHE